MRTAAFTLLCFVAFGNAMNAQRFSLLPQVGFENTKTSISYNQLSSFAPLGTKFSPQASLRLNYASKLGHGFFLGAATSRSLVSFSFSNPETGMNQFKAATGSMQLQLEGGYQFNSKRINLGKSQATNAKSKSSSTAKKSCGSSAQKSSGCSKSYSSSYSNRCGSKQAKNPTLAKNRGSWMRIQPSVGMGFIPAVQTDVVSKTQGSVTTYEYRAGNWQTGLIAGTSFEFGKNNTRKFTVSLNYFKGLGNLDEQSMTTSDGVKAITTSLKSNVSGWNMRIGIPFSLTKKPTVKKTEKKTFERKVSCGQTIIRYRCSGN
ncbi:MAG: hypothetical protein H7Y42_09415 [Chitinophagaceae bacterium]|nr:hypothetical protein [Chitinophagaceae bacterium]